MLLREVGGGLDSTKFQRRWRCTFPSDEISRYMRGRRLSVRALLQQCGNTFTISDIDGSRSKNPFATTEEREIEVSNKMPPPSTAPPDVVSRQANSAGGPLLFDFGKCMLTD